MKRLSMVVLVHMAAQLTTFPCDAQQPKQALTPSIEVIQFHNEHRCVTCMQIEKLTRTTLDKNFKGTRFTLVNVDDPVNAKKAEAFQAAGTALYLFNPKTGRKKDLTEFAFMKAFDEEKFKAELKEEIERFIKS